jgi:hypothetical protein
MDVRSTMGNSSTMAAVVRCATDIQSEQLVVFHVHLNVILSRIGVRFVVNCRIRPAEVDAAILCLIQRENRVHVVAVNMHDQVSDFEDELSHTRFVGAT